MTATGAPHPRVRRFDTRGLYDSTAKAILPQLIQQLLPCVSSDVQPHNWDRLKADLRFLCTELGQFSGSHLYRELYETMEPIRIVKRVGADSSLMPSWLEELQLDYQHLLHSS